MNVIMTYKGNTRKTMQYVIPFNSKLFDTFAGFYDGVIKIYDSFNHLLEDCVLEQFSSFDKMLINVYEDLATIDPITKGIAKALSNAISLSSYASQAIIQEISLKKCKFEQNKINLII